MFKLTTSAIVFVAGVQAAQIRLRVLDDSNSSAPEHVGPIVHETDDNLVPPPGAKAKEYQDSLKNGCVATQLKSGGELAQCTPKSSGKHTSEYRFPDLVPEGVVNE
mmetsp:Transcript_22570/g.27905  ORF Transcript_22570/g.27905 Transcript_22570/m.27905 type:complete len:106 (-) Transcript_22570:96-413(-)